MRFDAWNVSFPVDCMLDIETLLETDLSATIGPVARGLLGYRHSRKIQVEGSSVGMLLFGGNGGRFFVEMKGEVSDKWAKSVQAWSLQTGFEVHLTRADVCHDWEDDFDVVDLASSVRAKVGAAGGRAIHWSQQGDWASVEGRLRGCTLYMGAPTSAFRVRLYDKGRELMQRGIEASDRLRRVEVQARSSSLVERISWARAVPESFWRSSASIRSIADHFHLNAGTPLLRFRSAALDAEALLDHVCEQYGGPVLQLVHRLLGASAGSADQLLHLLSQEVLERGQRRRRLRIRA